MATGNGIGEDMDRIYGYSCEQQPFKQGAEARLYKCVYLGRPGVMKERFKKSYRFYILFFFFRVLVGLSGFLLS